MSFGRKKPERQRRELDPASRMLVAVLAASDAVWLPSRRPDDWTVITERRMLYRAAGIRWTSQLADIDPGTSGRKSAQRMLKQIGLDHQIIAHNPNGSRTLCVRLTETGEARAREMIGGPMLDDALELVDMLYGLRDHPDGFDYYSMAWVREATITGIGYGAGQDGEYHNLGICLSPALTRGMVESGSDLQMHASYALTPAGIEIARKRLHETPKPAPTPKPVDGGEDYYCQKLREALGALSAAEPENDSEIGLMPLPVNVPTRGMIARNATRDLTAAIAAGV